MTKTVGDFLRVFDATLYVIVYIGNDDRVWEGNLSSIPFWVSEYELDLDRYKREGYRPIEYRRSLGPDLDNQPGLIICVKESK